MRDAAARGLVNMYGITETTVHVTWRPVDRRRPAPPASARSACRSRICRSISLDRHGNRYPSASPARCCVGGAGVARGYLGPAGPDRRALRARSVRAACRERASTARATSRRAAPNGELEYLGRSDSPGQDPRLPDRARGDRGRAVAAPRGGGVHRPGARRRRRPPPRRLSRRVAGACAAERRRAARAPRRAAAGADDAVGVRDRSTRCRSGRPASSTAAPCRRRRRRGSTPASRAPSTSPPAAPPSGCWRR